MKLVRLQLVLENRKRFARACRLPMPGDDKPKDSSNNRENRQTYRGFEIHNKNQEYLQAHGRRSVGLDVNRITFELPQSAHQQNNQAEVSK